MERAIPRPLDSLPTQDHPYALTDAELFEAGLILLELKPRPRARAAVELAALDPWVEENLGVQAFLLPEYWRYRALERLAEGSDE